MRSLFLRIFTLFWLAMALIVGGSILITFLITQREYESVETLRRPTIAMQASAVLEKGGLSALKTWLARNQRSIPDREIYIIGPDGRDILGRRLSESAARRLDFISRETSGESPAPPAPPGNFRPQRTAPQIVGPDGATYTVLLVPRRPSIFGALSLPAISLTILGIALLVSAFASWWLAQHLSAPIRRIQAGARVLASENLDVRVSAGLESRHDEVAVLARDFDAMADRLRANRDTITQLLRDISHELRSPLARMRVALGLARQPCGDPQRQLDRLEREIERLDGLIGQVLKLARLHSHDALFERESFDFDEVLEEVVRDASFEGAIKNCRVELKGMAHATVQGNRELLRSAIENVLRNAVRYSPNGTAVEVSVERTPQGLSILIGDRGPGVPPGDLERIFEPFYRVAESRDRDSGGEGIGLAITSQVLKAHGGAARAANRPGGGFEVQLELPATALA
ncbi:MAG TPA: ATP-binding protein [Steroidobacteraceae bacterium]|nr:ATP-binding protein [Steroidobacteraceae bacterium]